MTRGRWRLSALMGAALAFVVGGLLGVRRRHVESAMQRAGVPRPRRAARAMYRSLGTGVFELIALRLWPRRAAEIEGLDHAIAQLGGVTRRGVVVATAHTGNWDWVACGLARRVQLTVISKRLSVGWLNRLWQQTRSRRGVEIVERGRAAKEAGARLARGGWVVAMVDQAPERRRAVAEVSFLGATACVDLAPALLAMRARCPLLVAFPRRTRTGHGVEVVGVLTPPERPSSGWPVEAMRQATLWLEAFVLRHPEQWLWMHRRWKPRPLC